MKMVSTEQLIERLGVDVYPITFIKFLLNKGKILSCFSKVTNKSFKIRGTTYLVKQDDCIECKKKGGKCRQHTSIGRILNAKKVVYDLDTKTYFYKNEIFRMVEDKLVIIYCPHPKLIVGSIDDSKVRRIRPITVYDKTLETLPKYELVSILSTDLLDKHMKCWFNKEFSIVTIPNEDGRHSNWCLIPNN